MSNVAILVPVCSRNQKYTSLDDVPFFKELFQSFEKTKEAAYTYTFFIGYDDDDEFYKQYGTKSNNKIRIFELTGCKNSPAKAWNKLAMLAYNDSETYYDYFFQIGDDVRIETRGWTTQFITNLQSHSNIGVVGPCYMKNYIGRVSAGNPPVIENAFVHRTHLDIFGFFFHPSINNWFCDDWISRVYDPYYSQIQTNILCTNTILGERYITENIESEIKNYITDGSKYLHPKLIFSYCIYGDNPKYCEGMIKNLEQISVLFPDYQTWIYLGNDVPSKYIERYAAFNNVKLIQTSVTGARLMLYRLFPLDNPFTNLLLVRDADSRLGERDVWCITHFLNTTRSVFTIRDHPWHAEPLMMGLSGFRNLPALNIQKLFREFYINKEGNVDYYQVDQNFAKEYIYNNYRNLMLAYTSFNKIEDDHNSTIDISRKNDTDFCGNVYLFDKDGNEYVEFNIYGKI
jgi:hypothetical protein